MGSDIPEIDFPLPWAVKPILEGSSIGISKVNNVDAACVSKLVVFQLLLNVAIFTATTV
jgi:hypothetical protein